jgi:hypothetical protein
MSAERLPPARGAAPEWVAATSAQFGSALAADGKKVCRYRVCMAYRNKPSKK